MPPIQPTNRPRLDWHYLLRCIIEVSRRDGIRSEAAETRSRRAVQIAIGTGDFAIGIVPIAIGTTHRAFSSAVVGRFGDERAISDVAKRLIAFQIAI
jgi:hypothetical protein